jgi:ribonuclease P protein component
MIGRIVQSVDFERVLAAPTRARSAHFAVHFLAARPAVKVAAVRHAAHKLSTGEAPIQGAAVDDLSEGACWLGTVVPKRHAKRSVTRNLLKRQIRRVVHAQVGLPSGLWVIRLRSPFDRKLFPSAASDALRAVAGNELLAVMAKAARTGA